jgi:hypothetical protein
MFDIKMVDPRRGAGVAQHDSDLGTIGDEPMRDMGS